MIKGATTQFRFNLPCSVVELQSVKITFWQPGNVGPTEDRPLPIVKVLSQCSILNSVNELCVQLDQEETLRFNDDRKAYVQFRGTTMEGVSYSSKPKELTIYPAYDDSIIGDVVIPTPGGDENDMIFLNGGIIGLGGD